MHAHIDVHSRILIAEFPGDVANFIDKHQSHCANVNFADKSRYDIIFQKVTHKGGESASNYIKRFQNNQDLSVSVVNTYSEDQLIQIFLDNFQQGGKYSAQIASHQAELRGEGKFTDQKYLSISSLQTDYINIDSSSGCDKNSERANLIHKKCIFVELPTIKQKNVSKESEKKRKSSCGWCFRQQTLDVDLKIT